MLGTEEDYVYMAILINGYLQIENQLQDFTKAFTVQFERFIAMRAVAVMKVLMDRDWLKS